MQEIEHDKAMGGAGSHQVPLAAEPDGVDACRGEDLENGAWLEALGHLHLLGLDIKSAVSLPGESLLLRHQIGL